MNTTKLRRNDLIYPDESYKIIGVLFDVHNELGEGHHEKYYQKAVAVGLEKARFKFKEQHYAPLKYKGNVIGRQYFDFLIDGKIILEIKKGNHFSRRHIEQISEYIKTSNLKLAILANFSGLGVQYKRIINFS